MTIKGPGAIDVDGVDCMTIDNSTNVWIDHCSLIDGQDGNMDIVNGSNYITVTWTKFSYTNASVGHQFSNLIGNSDSKTSDRGKLKVTLMFNYWTNGCVERMPRVRYGQVHVVNNLYDSPDANHGVRAGVEADIRVERNAFIGINKPIDLYNNDFTAVTAVNNLFSGTSGNTSGSGTAFTPPYTLTMIPAANVEATVKPCVGPTLTTPLACPCGTALPVSLYSFEVVEREEDYYLGWMIGEKEKVKEIVVEYSLEGTEFTTIAVLPGYTDQFILTRILLAKMKVGTLYVRLKILELNGEFTYSGVKLLRTHKSLSVYPNPFENIVWIKGGGGDRLRIYSSEGLVLKDILIPETEEVNLSLLPAGSYIFVLEGLLGGEVKRFLQVKF
jgi:hypothetical protein